MGRLTALKVVRSRKPGRYGDGDGLWLQVSDGGGRSWLLRYQLRGRARHMGLGPVDIVPLARPANLRERLADNYSTASIRLSTADANVPSCNWPV